MLTAKPPRSLIRGRWRSAAAVLVGAAALLLDFSGLLNPLENLLLESRFRLDHRSASPSLALVEVDAASIDAIGYWPLPRTSYANAIDRLLGNGLDLVAIDVDFSSRSLDSEDTALTDAVRRWGNRVVLATYGQRAGSGDTSSTVISRPVEPLDSLAELATVNVLPEPDGRVWRYPVGQWLGAEFKAALAIILAGSGNFEGNDFLVDFSIDPRTVPRIRLIDLISGAKLPPDTVTRAIIGTTAIDAGDRLTVPVHGNISGVELQAIAYSSIVSGRMIQSTGPPVTVAGLGLLLWLCHSLIRASWWRAVLGLAILAFGVYGASAAVQTAFPVSVDIAAWLAAITMWLLVTLIARLEEQGRAIAHQHAQVQLRDALLRTVVEENFDGVLITDTEERIEWLSPAGARLLNMRSQSVTGSSLIDQIPIFALVGAEADSDKITRQEIEYRTDDSDPLILDLVVGTTRVKLPRRLLRPAPADQVFRTYIFHDISERRRVEEARRNALEESERIQRAKSEFLSNMSHELRTPLNAIIGFADVISSEHMGPVGNPTYKEYAGLIQGSGTMLLEVINTILEVSRLEAGMLQTSDGNVNLAEIAKWCSQLTPGWSHLGHRNIDVVIEDNVPTVVCDELLIRQVVINLLSNAYKFTGEDGTIVVKVGTNASGLAYIEVKDDGIGIDRENLSRLFDAFYQVEGAFARRHGGSGLGLYLVRRYADLHNAEIKVSSEPGAGTTIRLVFPLERCRTPERAVSGSDG